MRTRQDIWVWGSFCWFLSVQMEISEAWWSSELGWKQKNARQSQTCFFPRAQGASELSISALAWLLWRLRARIYSSIRWPHPLLPSHRLKHILKQSHLDHELSDNSSLRSQYRIRTVYSVQYAHDSEERDCQSKNFASGPIPWLHSHVPCQSVCTKYCCWVLFDFLLTQGFSMGPSQFPVGISSEPPHARRIPTTTSDELYGVYMVSTWRPPSRSSVYSNFQHMLLTLLY